MTGLVTSLVFRYTKVNLPRSAHCTSCARDFFRSARVLASFRVPAFLLCFVFLFFSSLVLAPPVVCMIRPLCSLYIERVSASFLTYPRNLPTGSHLYSPLSQERDKFATNRLPQFPVHFLGTITIGSRILHGVGWWVPVAETKKTLAANTYIIGGRANKQPCHSSLLLHFFPFGVLFALPPLMLFSQLA